MPPRRGLKLYGLYDCAEEDRRRNQVQRKISPLHSRCESGDEQSEGDSYPGDHPMDGNPPTRVITGNVLPVSRLLLPGERPLKALREDWEADRQEAERYSGLPQFLGRPNKQLDPSTDEDLIRGSARSRRRFPFRYVLNVLNIY